MTYLSLIMAIRFLGLFIVMPLLAIFAMHLQGATDTTIGIAIGAYALSQMFLQVFFGKMSDKYGRKHILAFGLLLLAIGSVVCAMSDNIYTLIFGRLLQGAGAIGGVVLAYLNDLATEETRGKVFARMGQFIALAFGISMIVGPTIGAKYGVHTLFYITAILALFSIVLLYIKVPNPPKIEHFEEHIKISEVFKNKELLKIYFSGFMQKGMMVIIFMITPLIFVNELGWDKFELWKVYVPALVFGIFAMPLGAILAEKKHKGKLVFILSAIFMVSSVVAFLFKFYIVGVILFFFGFNMLEPVLQSFTGKVARVHEKATAMSIGNSIQYLGIFLGGAVAGAIKQYYGYSALFYVILAMGIIWIVLLATMKDFKGFEIKEYDKWDDEFIENMKKQDNVHDLFIKEEILIVRFIKE
ncbi:MAG: MFS transporter [Epsilonproteobacteria bacterium]|nr:MFS transporter [Campylobacterota bacterium]